MSERKVLHVTHGDSGNRVLTAAGLPGELLPWDDVLHQGPVPANLNLDELSDVRAKFIAGQGWGEYTEVRERFIVRNRKLADYARDGEVVIWSTFELYDQLHLAQILDWFEQHSSVVSPPHVIWLSGYFEEQPRTELRNWYQTREPVDAEVVAQASGVWQAFRSENPEDLERRVDDPLSGLPFMRQALRRLLQEYPGLDDGLSRTQRQILSIIDEADRTAVELFEANQARESPAFMGDWSFWWEVEDLMGRKQPPVLAEDEKPLQFPPRVGQDDRRFLHTRLKLSPLGQRLMLGREDHVLVNGIDRWIGGVHLRPEWDWRWSAARESLIQGTPRRP